MPLGPRVRDFYQVQIKNKIFHLITWSSNKSAPSAPPKLPKKSRSPKSCPKSRSPKTDSIARSSISTNSRSSSKKSSRRSSSSTRKSEFSRESSRDFHALEKKSPKCFDLSKGDEMINGEATNRFQPTNQMIRKRRKPNTFHVTNKNGSNQVSSI